MEDNLKRKKNILIILGMCILIISVVGITLAFFNYNNTLRLGTIEFSSNYMGITLQNVFPVRSN